MAPRYVCVSQPQLTTVMGKYDYQWINNDNALLLLVRQNFNMHELFSFAHSGMYKRT